MQIGADLLAALRGYVPGFRERRGLSQRQLAAAIGCAQSSLSRFEAGGAMPAEDILNLLAYVGWLVVEPMRCAPSESS